MQGTTHIFTRGNSVVGYISLLYRTTCATTVEAPVDSRSSSFLPYQFPHQPDSSIAAQSAGRCTNLVERIGASSPPRKKDAQAHSLENAGDSTDSDSVQWAFLQGDLRDELVTISKSLICIDDCNVC